jgi:hypothetical protein
VAVERVLVVVLVVVEVAYLAIMQLEEELVHQA